MNPPDLSRLLAARDENDLHAANMAAMSERFDKLRDRHTNGTAPRAVSAFQLFQTPPDLAARMVELAEPRPGLSWLEPSAGLGRILRPILATRPAWCMTVDESPDCSAELEREFPDVIHHTGDFLEKVHGVFDRVVMNPPFHMRADLRHVEHARRHLQRGGVLVGLCMATRHRAEALQPLADHWEEIPAGTFRKEGTGVACYLFRIRA